MATRPVSTQGRSTNADGVVFRKVWLFGLIAVVAAVAVNLLLLPLVNAIYRPSVLFPALTPPAIGMFTTIGAVGAVLVFAALVRFTQRPIRVFQIVSLVVFIVTLLPNLGFAIAQLQTEMAAGFLWLILFHIPPAIFPVWLLSTRTRA